MTVNPLQAFQRYDLISQKKFPIEIAPRASERVFLSDVAMLEAEAKRMKATISFFRALRLRFIKAVVATDDGRLFRVSVGDKVRDVWNGPNRLTPPVRCRKGPRMTDDYFISIAS